MLFQAALFIGSSYFIYMDMVRQDGKPSGDAAGASILLAFVITVVTVAIINGAQNWLIRRRGRLSTSVGLPDEPDHDSYGLRRIGPGSEQSLKIPEIPLREKPRKILRPPS
jgi:hypothetical protein